MKLKTTNPSPLVGGGVLLRNNRRRFLTSGEELGGMATVGNGVYIQDINGRYWTEDMWDGSVEPNGIAVITDECSFVISLTENNSISFGGTGEKTNLSLQRYRTIDSAITDYNGKTNTDALVSFYPYGASKWCSTYIFPNGHVGYLGSAGEWQKYLENEDYVDSLIDKVGGTPLAWYYWSSTRGELMYDHYIEDYNECFWRFFKEDEFNSSEMFQSLTDPYISDQLKRWRVRPFTTL